MTLSAVRNTPQIDGSAVPTVFELPAAVDILYAGGMAVLNSSGYIVPAGSTTGTTAVLGRIERTVDNSAGSAGDLNVPILAGQFKWDNSGTSILSTHRGQLCYAVDDESVHISNAGGRAIAGMIMRVDSDGVVVQTLFPFAALASASVGGANLQSLHAVRGASTANVASLAAFTVAGVDGLTYVEGERILLKNQSTASQNGIYVVGTVGGGTAALTRALDADGLDEVVPGMLVYVSEGTENGNSWYFLSTDATITVGTTSLTFTEVPALHDLASTANGEGAALIGIEDVATAFDATTVEGAFAELVAVTAGNGANIIGYEDAGGFTAAADVDAALDEIYQDLLSTKCVLDIPCNGAWYENDGTALAAFADGASPTPGLAMDGSEGAGIRWNNHANPDPIAISVPVPYDLDESADVTLEVICWKTGATLADAVTWDVLVFNNVVGALYDADANFGGTSAAITGDAATKTVQSSALTLTAANLANPDAAHAQMTLSIQPTDGTLGTDDITAGFVRLTYTRKLRTA